MTDYLLVCEHPCKRKKLASPRTIRDQTVAQTWLMDSKQLITTKHLTFSAPAYKNELFGFVLPSWNLWLRSCALWELLRENFVFSGTSILTNPLKIPKLKIYSQNQTEEVMDLRVTNGPAKEDGSGQQDAATIVCAAVVLLGVLVSVSHVGTSICSSCHTSH